MTLVIVDACFTLFANVENSKTILINNVVEDIVKMKKLIYSGAEYVIAVAVPRASLNRGKDNDKAINADIEPIALIIISANHLPTAIVCLLTGANNIIFKNPRSLSPAIDSAAIACDDNMTATNIYIGNTKANISFAALSSSAKSYDWFVSALIVNSFGFKLLSTSLTATNPL